MTNTTVSDASTAELLRLMDSREYGLAYSGIQLLLERSDGIDAHDLAALQVMAAECLAFMGRSDEAINLAGPLSDSLRDGKDHHYYGRACVALAIANYSLGDMQTAADYAETSYFAFKRVNDTLGMIKALNWSGNVQFYLGEYNKAIACHSDAWKMASEASLTRWQAAAGLNVTLCHILTGNLKLARETMDANWPIVLEHGDKTAVRRNMLVNAFLSTQERHFESAGELLERIRVSATPDQPRRDQGAWCEYMGELLLATGRLEEAEAEIKRGIDIASSDPRDESVIGQSRRLLSEVRLAQHDYIEAIAEGERALDSIRNVGERFEEGVMYRVMGEARMRIGQDSEARAAFKHSMGILRSIGACLEWAKSCLTAGRSDVFSRRERLAYLVEAERMFAEIGVGYWIEQTRDELKSVMKDREQELLAQSPTAAQSSQPVFVSANRETLETVRIAERLARTDIAVLITGETGAGKDQLARHIHACSPRGAAKFVTIDLSALPESLWESEVFGHRKGVFTGANCDKIGLLESANGGTVFLNEIGNLPLPFQAKLLEMLDSRRIRRVGDTDTRALDVRFVAATNVNLQEAVAQGQFRRDLYYRLAEAPLHLNPLRERREDIVPLLKYFLLQRGVPIEDLELLDRQLWVDRAYNGHWAGNVRQLESFVHRLVAIAERPADPAFPVEAERHLEAVDVIHEPNVGGKITRASLLAALDRNNGNQRATARDLGVTEGGVRHLMRRFGIQKPY